MWHLLKQGIRNQSNRILVFQLSKLFGLCELFTDFHFAPLETGLHTSASFLYLYNFGFKLFNLQCPKISRCPSIARSETVILTWCHLCLHRNNFCFHAFYFISRNFRFSWPCFSVVEKTFLSHFSPRLSVFLQPLIAAETN